jgi:hypothetical protein
VTVTRRRHRLIVVAAFVLVLAAFPLGFLRSFTTGPEVLTLVRVAIPSPKPTTTRSWPAALTPVLAPPRCSPSRVIAPVASTSSSPRPPPERALSPWPHDQENQQEKPNNCS